MNKRWLIAATAIAFLASGCLWETASWSPSGRYLAFVDVDDDSVWIWDTETQTATECDVPGGSDFAQCRFISEDELLLFEGDQDPVCVWSRKDNTLRELPVEGGPDRCTVSDDGKHVYVTVADGGVFTLVELPLREKGEPRILYTSTEEMALPGASHDGKRIAFSCETGLYVFTKETGKATRVLDSQEKYIHYWPIWVDDQTLLFIRMVQETHPDSNSGVAHSEEGNVEFAGTLMRLNLKDGSTHTLCKFVAALDRPDFAEDGKEVIVSAAVEDLADYPDAEDCPSTWQLVAVNLETGERRTLTDEPSGAGYAVCAPKGGQVAYHTPPDPEGATMRILDLKTGKRSMPWRNEVERLFSTALRLEQENEQAQALATYDELLSKFPETELDEQAAYAKLALYLRPPTLDLDKAFTILGPANLDELRDSDRALIWREEDRVAADPTGDWIRTYGTEASEKEFGFKTDDTRDLLGLWARWSPERLYLRVDMASNRDLDGLTFSDLVLLFDMDSPDEGYRPIGPRAQWNRGAERQVVIRHWYRNGDRSQYDVEIRDGAGEMRCRFLASGFDDPQCPVLGLLQPRGAWGDAPGSILLSLSREAMGLKGEGDVYVQACTFKGGIEEFKKLERPREPAATSGPVCDVADAFGEENTATRINADIAAVKAQAATTAPWRASIRGYAGVLHVPPKPEE
jgi:dipeptidyl aminopeptidase/acylaminoacyl peptidase